MCQRWEQARDHAEAILLGNGGSLGLLGSNQAYQQVWARDSMLCGWGLMACQSAEGAAIHKRSLETLRTFQSPLGKIPHNVGKSNVADPALIAHGGALTSHRDEIVQDTCHSGCVDGNLLYILGQYHYWALTHDDAYLDSVWPSLEAALLWLRYQDSNECGLLEVHEAMDWADLYANRYNVLFDNVLYYGARKAMGLMVHGLCKQDETYERSAEEVKDRINRLMWVGPEEPNDYEWIAQNRKEWLYPVKRMETELVERSFYMPYVAFRDFADRFDTLGNLMAILMGLADQQKADKILDYIQMCGMDEPYPVQAVYPPVMPGEADWRTYYRVRNLNLPHHYHNGGAWPFIGGIYVMALVKAGRMEQARQKLDSLTAMVHRGRSKEWEFNEWFHGTSGQPMGYGGQSWSCAMYIAAYQAVTNKEALVFGQGPWRLEGMQRR